MTELGAAEEPGDPEGMPGLIDSDESDSDEERDAVAAKKGTGAAKKAAEPRPKAPPRRPEPAKVCLFSCSLPRLGLKDPFAGSAPAV